MSLRWGIAFTALTLCGGLWSNHARAGLEEGVTAYQRKDFASASKEFQTLAEHGDASAQHNLALMYDKGQGVAQDYKEAAKWFRLAADQGGAAAQNSLGRLYYNGQGVAQDYREAGKWFRLAADQGIAAAQHNLARMYYSGQGVPQDYKEAAKWFRRAAEHGVAEAQYNLGSMHARGEIGQQDYREAIKWFRLAADRGDVWAQYNLGVMYANGWGVPEHRIVAYALHDVAKGGDQQKAVAIPKALANSMSAQDIQAAQELSRVLAPPGNLLRALDSYVKQQRWMPIGGMQNSSMHYVDSSTIRRIEDGSQILEMRDFAEEQFFSDGKPYRSTTTLTEFNCVEKRSHVLQFSIYPEHIGNGSALYTSVSSPAFSRPWRQVTPGSIGEKVFKIACNQD